MADRKYAKVVIGDDGPTFEAYRQKLAKLTGPGLDAGLLQVGVHEAVLRPHVLTQLHARHPGKTISKLLKEAGADRAELIEEADAWALYRQRVEEDLEPRAAAPIPENAGGRAWHLKAINVQPAWDALGGPDAIAWDGIRIGQIDTGYTQHMAFGHGQSGGSWIASADCRTFMNPDTPPEFAPPVITANNGVDPMPFGALSKGHGTRIGSAISGWARLPDGFVFRGVAPRVPHVMVRITDSVAINTRQAEFVQALRYLVDVAGVDVVNVSLGVFPPVVHPDIRDAMAHARSKGVIVVCAAGNHVDPVVVPAKLDTAIAVAGTTWQSLPWSGSSFGPEVDFSAPASGIFRADAQRTGVGSGFAGGGDGTSYATAITTGSAALWLRRWRSEINAKYGRSAKRVDAFREAVRATCRKPPGWQPEPFGAGIIDTGRLCTDLGLALPNIAGSFTMPPVAAPVG